MVFTIFYRELLDTIETEGNDLTTALPLHAFIDNVVQQLSHIIKEEYRTAVTKTRPALQTVQRFLQGSKSLRSDEENYTVNVEGLQEAVVDHLAEFQTELELSVHNIAEQATGHIHASDIIMTIGNSTLVQAFILAKAQEEKPKFEVVVVEGAPFCEVK
ncbi:hypothetical protein B566_EDAN014689 [Ephemera danica]|nr:hypothetical protein B566_EDAN014689 [Ephemera danica]